MSDRPEWSDHAIERAFRDQQRQIDAVKAAAEGFASMPLAVARLDVRFDALDEKLDRVEAYCQDTRRLFRERNERLGGMVTRRDFEDYKVQVREEEQHHREAAEKRASRRTIVWIAIVGSILTIVQIGISVVQGS